MKFRLIRESATSFTCCSIVMPNMLRNHNMVMVIETRNVK
jgi:hypothetical protein